MDEEMLQQAALEQMLGGGAPVGDPMGDPMAADPFGSSPPGYTMVYVPDSILPAVMELVEGAESNASAMGAGAPPADMMGAAPLM
jgi:hypothetical protein